MRLLLAAFAALAVAAALLVAISLARAEEAPTPPAPAAETGRAQSFRLSRVADGLVRPVWAGQAPGDRGGVWVLEQPGRILRIDGEGRRRTVLDLRSEVITGAEQGLLGLAFDPDFERTRRVFAHWSQRPTGDTRVAEFVIDPDGRGARRGRTLLALEQPEENHNGGALAFAPDGRLHLGLGDGGGAFDPREKAQDPGSLLGKLIALDLDRPGRPRWEVVLSGLRNPYRLSFDAALNEVWIGDVGQDGFEEVNRVALESDEPPKNLGWPVYEGVERVDGGDRELDDEGELVFPVGGYSHAGGACSITGGVVYRGARIPALAGRYVYGDYCRGTLFSARPKPAGGLEDVRRERAELPELTHVGTDADGELLLTSARGDVLRALPSRR